MYLIYNEQGNIEAIEGKTAQANYFLLEDIEVGPNYIGELNSTLDKVHPSVLGPEWVMLIKLFITFLLSEDGQYFMSRVINWVYQLWLRLAVKKFVKKYQDGLVAVTGETNLDKMKNTLYSHSLAILQYQLNTDAKTKLYKAFQKG